MESNPDIPNGKVIYAITKAGDKNHDILAYTGNKDDREYFESIVRSSNTSSQLVLCFAAYINGVCVMCTPTAETTFSSFQEKLKSILDERNLQGKENSQEKNLTQHQRNALKREQKSKI